MYETSGRRATDEFPRHVLIPDLEVAKDGQESRSDIEYPLEMKLVQRKSPAKIELVMRFEDEIVKFEGAQLKRSQGVQTLRRLLGSDLLCSPKLRQLLERVAVEE
jgi:hypothetical protein